MYGSTCSINMIGESACRWLISGQRGEVVASVSQAAYLLTEENELIWLMAKAGPMHRRCLQLMSPVPKLAVGSNFDVLDRTLVMSSGEVMDFSQSTVWKPPFFGDREPVPVTWLRSLVRYAYLRMIAEQEPLGWGGFIPAILQMVPHQTEPAETKVDDFTSGKAWPAISGILQACKAHDLTRILTHAQDLVGLGAGLTPSGDDFLGGFFYCIWFLKQGYPGELDLVAWNYSDFILQCKPLTNLISLTLLKDLSDGYAVEPLYQIANTLLEGKPVDHFLRYAKDLVSIGHSTGWDILTGFLAGMFVTCSDSKTTL